MDDLNTHEIINDRNWDLLFDAIEKERVVPIIGGNFFYEEGDGKQNAESINNYILEQLKCKLGIQENDVDFTAISDFIEEENFRNRRSRFIGNQTDVYFEIDSILRNVRLKCKSEILKFLSIGKFPLILTTSYLPGLETELQTQYEDIDVVVYDKSSRADIGTTLSSSKPLLYYLFGKVNRIKKSFMVTEDDLLDYMHLWHNMDTRPVRISEYLKDKFLLVMGCDYPNWLFRFFWHSIRNFTLVPASYEMQGVVALENGCTDRELAKFLSRIQTQIYDNSNSFIEEFLRRWNNRKKAPGMKQREVVNKDADIFISYAREDAEVVRTIAGRLRELGAEVWLDENNLEWSDMYEDIIQEKITKAKRFVPILSHTTMQQERRFFRREWAMALREVDFRCGMPYFAPILIDDSDVNSTLIPEPFRRTHIISIADEGFETEMKKLIRSFR